MFGYDRGSGLVRSRFVRYACLALLAFIERVQLGDGVRDTLPHVLLLARSKSQRAHHQTALLPRLGLSGMIQSAEFDSIFKANCHRIGRLIERSVGVRDADLARLEHTAKDRGKHAVEFRFWHLLGRARAQVVTNGVSRLYTIQHY